MVEHRSLPLPALDQSAIAPGIQDVSCLNPFSMAKRNLSKKRSKRVTPAPKTRPARVDVVTEQVVTPALQVTPTTVDEVTTTTEVETVPKVEIRKPATLAQALTEPATVVVKPEKKARTRTVRSRRIA